MVKLLKRKIFISYLVLVIIGISTTGLFVSQLTQSLYRHEVEQRLITAASLIEHQISQNLKKGQIIDFNLEAVAYADILRYSSLLEKNLEKLEPRITFIDYNGKVIGESDADFQSMENHLGRKEIKEAVNGGIGLDIRFSETLKMDFIYVAKPVKAAETVIRVSLPLTQLKNINRTIWLYSGIGILAGLALTMLLAVKFTSSLTLPVNELNIVSREISRGNYSKRASVKSDDELGQLAGTFNEMANELEKTVADLKDKNIKFDSIMNSMTNGFVAVDRKQKILLINEIACRFLDIDYDEDIIGKNLIDVIRNHKINKLLLQTVESNKSSVHEISISQPDEKTFRIYANPIKYPESSDSNSGGILSIMDITNIKKLEQIRTDFVSNVTHELKTPLTSIRGFVETLRSGAIDDGEVSDKFLEIIDIEAERLYMLINDILQLSEIETKQKDSNIATHDFGSIINEVFSILQGAADKKSIELSCNIEGSINITANRDRIKQMLINLIDNAIKYNVENGSVRVKAWKAEGRIVLSVKDTGIGIAQQHLTRIFERFYRVDKGRSRNMGGTGLGLSIVKHIVNLYNGDIKVESEPGKGTEFVIQLPA
ncbi:MAG: PAS domain-containing sensor histidine kinase [Clostridiales bacterium GWC2_40_7]|nr:MAG: PAS domain-containing sensor histidine kinase [Clostridiales bacterium GWC2_40_7]